VTGLGRRLGAQDDVALLERGSERGQLVIGQLVLVGERLELLFLDETALGGLLDQALGRREIVQVNRIAQFNPSLGSWRGRFVAASFDVRARVPPRDGQTPRSEL
jgi:hypothetical protein